MKLFPHQIEPTLYEQGFGEDDILGRREYGRKLSELLERIEDPLVVALDGPWGSGKSHFLKRWVGAHVNENGGTATTVYFDAFANDYLDDPLIGLTGAIGERLPSLEDKSQWKKAKTFALKLTRPVLRVGAAVATSGLTELTGPVLDAAIEAGGKQMEDAAEAFWKQEDGRRAAMQQFRHALNQLTLGQSGNDIRKPLIVVIDELDRCRPDYALLVLEVVKHFFSVPRVHFVLGVNLKALEHIVCARYGVGVDAEDYLKRFITLSMQLSESLGNDQERRSQLIYFQASATDMGISGKIAEIAKTHIGLAIDSSRISLRDVEKILTRLALIPQRRKIESFLWGWQETIVSLIILNVIRKDLYTRAISGNISIKEIDNFYGITSEMIDRVNRQSGRYIHRAFIIHGLWDFLINRPEAGENDSEMFSQAFDAFGSREAGRIVRDIHKNFLSTFEVISES